MDTLTKSTLIGTAIGMILFYWIVVWGLAYALGENDWNPVVAAIFALAGAALSHFANSDNKM